MIVIILKTFYLINDFSKNKFWFKNVIAEKIINCLKNVTLVITFTWMVI